MRGQVHPFAFWGKLQRSPSGEVVEWHPLVDHCLDVALTLRALIQLPPFGRALQQSTATSLDEQAFDRLAVLGFLHDVGKCNWGFQAKCGPMGPTAGHTLETVGLFSFDSPPDEWAQLLGEMRNWFAQSDSGLDSMLLASISHHGRPISGNDLDHVPGDPRRWWRATHSIDPMRGVAELANTVRAAFPAAFASGRPMDAGPAFQHRFAGLVMLADWIASDTTFFPYRDGEAERRFDVARAAAGRALTSIGLVSRPSQHDIALRTPTFEQLFGRKPHPLQRFIAEQLPIDDASRLVLIESDTGSGKTEAALSWFLRLFAAQRVDGLYFALPTRVAARELYGRVCRAIADAFPDPMSRPSPVLLAVPGYARADGEPALAEPREALWPDRPEETLREAVWAAERPKRFLAAPVAVGAIDQALLSSLQVRHAHLRSVCLDRHLLVVDEVHASDPYMRDILAQLLHGHCARGGHVMLLSATLGESARTHLLSDPQAPLDQARCRDYPLVSTLVEQYAVASPEGRAKRVKIETSEHLESPEALVPRVTGALAEGARILIVMNTVKRANAMLRAIESSGLLPNEARFRVNEVPCPHHGRFARPDREFLDAAVSARLGPGCSPGPVLVLGTQTLEQSLDIDADWLITDACPMDVLLQRLGRLHRHSGRARPRTHRHPQALVLTPQGGDFSQFIDPRGRARGPGGIGSVYSDARILQRTIELLRQHTEIEVPRDNRPLVEEALHPESLAALASPVWDRHARYLEGVLLAELRQAEIGALNEVPFGECQFRADDGPIVTRLGANDRRARLPTPIRSPFGATIDELLIPGHMARDVTEEVVSDLATDPDGFRFRLGDRTYHYSRFGLELLDA